MSSSSRSRSRDAGGAGEASGGTEVDEKVVTDLINNLLDPSFPRLSSSTRALIAPNLVIDFPLFPQPAPTAASKDASTTSAQALSLFRLPAVAVNALPGAEWSLKVRRVKKTGDGYPQLGMSASSATHGGGSLTSAPTSPPAFVETWSAEVRWQLSLGGSSSPRQPSSSAGGLDSDDPCSTSSTAISKMRQGAPLWRKRSEIRVVELTFAPKPLDPVEEQKKREREKVVSCDVEGGEGETMFDFASHTYAGAYERGKGVASTSASGGQVEKAIPTEEDEPVQPLQLVHVRYKLPPSSSTSILTSYIPPVARPAPKSAFLTLLGWLLPLIYALVCALGLDSTKHVLPAADDKKLHRQGAIGHHRHRHREKSADKGKGKETEQGGSKHSSRRRSPSVKQPPLSLDIGAGIEEPHGRLAGSSTASDSEDTIVPTGHPSHVGRSRKWSTSTTTSRASKPTHGEEHVQAKQGLLDSLYSSARGYALDAASSLSAVSDAAHGVVSDAKDVGWTIRQGVVFITQLVAAAVDVGRGVVSLEDEDEGGWTGGGSRERERGVKRRLSSIQGGAQGEEDEKRAKHFLGEDVGRIGTLGLNGAEEGNTAEGGAGETAPKTPVSPVSPTSPHKSAMSTNGHKAPPHLKKRVSFSASSDFIPGSTDSPLPAASPAPRAISTAPQASTAVDELSLLHHVETSPATDASRILTATESLETTHGVFLPPGIEAEEQKTHNAAAAETALLASVDRGVDAASTVERYDELEAVKLERSLKREEHEREKEVVKELFKERGTDVAVSSAQRKEREGELEQVKHVREVHRAEHAEEAEKLQAFLAARGLTGPASGDEEEGEGKRGKKASQDAERRRRRERESKAEHAQPRLIGEDFWDVAQKEEKKERPGAEVKPPAADGKNAPLPATSSSTLSSTLTKPAAAVGGASFARRSSRAGIAKVEAAPSGGGSTFGRRSSRVGGVEEPDPSPAPPEPSASSAVAHLSLTSFESGASSSSPSASPSAGDTSTVPSGFVSPLSGLAAHTAVPPQSKAHGHGHGNVSGVGLVEKLKRLEPAQKRRGGGSGEGMDTPPHGAEKGEGKENLGGGRVQGVSGMKDEWEEMEREAKQSDTPSSDKDVPGSSLSLPLQPNTAAKLALHQKLESSGGGGGGFTRPIISSPHRLEVEEIPTPAESGPVGLKGISGGGAGGGARLRRRESEEERRERIGVTGVRVEGGQSARGGIGGGGGDEGKTPTAASFAQAVKDGESEGGKQEKEEEKEEQHGEVDLSDFYTPPTHPSAPLLASTSTFSSSSSTASPVASLSSLPPLPHASPSSPATSPGTPMKKAFERLGAERGSPVASFASASASAAGSTPSGSSSPESFATAASSTTGSHLKFSSASGGWGDEAAHTPPPPPEGKEGGKKKEKTEQQKQRDREKKKKRAREKKLVASEEKEREREREREREEREKKQEEEGERLAQEVHHQHHHQQEREGEGARYGGGRM